MRTSEHLNEISPALVAALGQLKNPRPDSKATVQTRSGGTYAYDYLSLPALLDATRKALKEHGLAIVQEVSGEPGAPGITTRILHSISGQFIETGPLVLPGGQTAQDHGGAITYGRRYALAAMLGLAADEDSDGKSVEAEERPRAGARNVPPGQRDLSASTDSATSDVPVQQVAIAEPAGVRPHRYAGKAEKAEPCTFPGCGMQSEADIHLPRPS